MTKRSCERCGLTAELEPASGGRTLVRWSDGSEERLLTLSLPPDGSFACKAHRPGSRWSHHCLAGHVHATVEGARACDAAGGSEPRGWGLVTP